MGIGLPVVGEGWWRIDIGEDGDPHGVSMLSVAARVKLGRAWMPVPPMTAIRTGSVNVLLLVGFDLGYLGNGNGGVRVR